MCCTTSKRLTKNILVCVVMLMVFVLPVRVSAFIGIKEGDPLKKFVLKDLSGAQVDIAGFLGRSPVIIVFWKLTENKAFIDYSMDELLFVESFYEQYHEKPGLEIFGIYTPKQDKEIPAEEVTAVKDFIKLNKITFPVLLDEDFRIFREYGVIALPATVMIDKAGQIGFIYPSFPLSARPLFSEKIKDLVGMTESPVKNEKEEIKRETILSNRFYHYSLQTYKKGLSEQALSPLKKSLAINPDFPWAHNLMGIILWEGGDYQAAADEFMLALKLDQNNGAAHFNYGLLLYEHEKYKEAEEHLKRALAINNAYAEAHYVLGHLYKDMKRTGEALGELKTALEFFEKNKSTLHGSSDGFLRISTYYALSELYQQAGDEKRAFDLLHDAIRIAIGPEDGTGKGKLYRSKKLMLYE